MTYAERLRDIRKIARAALGLADGDMDQDRALLRIVDLTKTKKKKAVKRKPTKKTAVAKRKPRAFKCPFCEREDPHRHCTECGSTEHLFNGCDMED